MTVAAPAVEVVNENGGARCLLVCDHASRRVPDEMSRHGFSNAGIDEHYLWDPGARELALDLSARLDAPLVCSTVSRLVIDCNRDPGAADLVVAECGGVAVSGNQNLDREEIAYRVGAYHEPYHDAIDALLAARAPIKDIRALVAIHSFTPEIGGRVRPWHIGVLFDQDRRIANRMLPWLATEPGLVVGENQPYSPADGVYYTLTRHADSQGLASVMLELRNDVIITDAERGKWADRLAPLLLEAVERLDDLDISTSMRTG